MQDIETFNSNDVDDLYIEFFNQNVESLISVTENEELLYQFNKLYNLVQPEQKSKEWYELRKNMITASNISTILGENHFDKAESVILDKITKKPFFTNIYMYHGIEYEEIALMIYESIFNLEMFSFGLIQHDEYSYLGASPDGISPGMSLDQKIEEECVGEMIEIKCPSERKINDKIPEEYLAQMQIQLQCCGLKECDFWQCNIEESKTWIDNNEESMVYNCFEDCEVQPKNFCFEGIILLYLSNAVKNPIESDEHKYDFKVIYPDVIEESRTDYEIWAHYQSEEIIPDYYFYEEYYWELINAQNIVVPVDNEWFESELPLIEEKWDYIELLRNNEMLEQQFIQEFDVPKKKYF